MDGDTGGKIEHFDMRVKSAERLGISALIIEDKKGLKKNSLLEDTSKHGVEFGLHYPMPIHRQKAFKTHPQYRSKFNNADTFSNQLLSLPIFPKMKDREIERVIEVVSEYAVS